MIVTNKKTGKDITGLYIKLMEGKITNQEFEEKTGLVPSDDNPHRKAWEKRQEKEVTDLTGNGWYSRKNSLSKRVDKFINNK